MTDDDGVNGNVGLLGTGNAVDILRPVQRRCGDHRNLSIRFPSNDQWCAVRQPHQDQRNRHNQYQ